MPRSENPERRNIRFVRRPRPRPPLWPVLIAAIVLIVLLILARWLRS
jgi:hypothetical protein